MEFKVGQILDALPEAYSLRGRGMHQANRAVFITENYAEKLTAQPGKWVVLDIMEDRKKSKFHTRETNYNKKYNSKGFEFRRILTETNQIFLGKYNPTLLT
jgi:hypothetical protein